MHNSAITTLQSMFDGIAMVHVLGVTHYVSATTTLMELRIRILTEIQMVTRRPEAPSGSIPQRLGTHPIIVIRINTRVEENVMRKKAVSSGNDWRENSR